MQTVGSDGLLALELIPLVPFPSSGLLIEDERGKLTVVRGQLECGHSTLMYLQTEAPTLTPNTATPPLQDVLRQWCSGEMNKVTAELSGCYENQRRDPHG